MTSLIAWIGVDSRGPASFYMASDSRISWGAGGNWDFGRKLFATRVFPDLFGYCGDVLFPSLVLGQFMALVDAGCLCSPEASAEERHTAMVGMVRTSFEGLPPAVRRSFLILHCGREGEGMTARFQLWRSGWSPRGGWEDTMMTLPVGSTLVSAEGSGGETVLEYDRAWRGSQAGRSSRAVYSAFCDALKSARDPHSGGGPQLVGLYRKWPARLFGTICDDHQYLLGLPSPNTTAPPGIEWRNERFERCDPRTMTILPGAQRQPRPTGL